MVVPVSVVVLEPGLVLEGPALEQAVVLVLVGLGWEPAAAEEVA